MSEFSDIQDPLMLRLKWVIKGAVRMLAILMTAVILLKQHLSDPPSTST
jgi:hypothetical protein